MFKCQITLVKYKSHTQKSVQHFGFTTIDLATELLFTLVAPALVSPTDAANALITRRAYERNTVQFYVAVVAPILVGIQILPRPPSRVLVAPVAVGLFGSEYDVQRIARVHARTVI